MMNRRIIKIIIIIKIFKVICRQTSEETVGTRKYVKRKITQYKKSGVNS